MVLKKSFIDRLKVNHDSESEFVSKKIFFFLGCCCACCDCCWCVIRLDSNWGQR